MEPRHTIGGRSRPLPSTPWTRVDEAHSESRCRNFLLRRKAGCGRARTARFCGDAVLPQRDFDLTSGPQRPAGFQRQDGIGRRSLGKGRRVRSVIPAWRGQRTATTKRAPPIVDGMGALSPRATVAVHRKMITCFGEFSMPRRRLADRLRRIAAVADVGSNWRVRPITDFRQTAKRTLQRTRFRNGA